MAESGFGLRCSDAKVCALCLSLAHLLRVLIPCPMPLWAHGLWDPLQGVSTLLNHRTWGDFQMLSGFPAHPSSWAPYRASSISLSTSQLLNTNTVTTRRMRTPISSAVSKLYTQSRYRRPQGKASRGSDCPLFGDLARCPEAKNWTEGCVTFDT